MAKLIFKNSGEIVELEDNSPIAQACEEAGIPFACTEGICGTCIVNVTKGMENLTPPNQQEKDFLGDNGVCKERMCCQCKILQGEVEIEC